MIESERPGLLDPGGAADSTTWVPLDVLLVHVPKLLERSPITGWGSRINFLSMGIFSIAEELTRQRLATRIVHLGVEKQLDRSFRLADYVRRHAVPVVAFALHWHPQSYDTIEAARQLKAAVPETRIVLGGLTASHFAREILETHRFIDAVICGEAERPLAQYVAAQRTGASLATVENLFWRDDAGEDTMIRAQPVTFVSNADDMNGWRFDAWDLLEHRETYLLQNWGNSWEPELAAQSSPREATIFGAALGRGCMGTCTWCSGSFGPMKVLTGRKKTAWRSADRIAQTMDSMRSHGVRRIYTCFDPLPNRMREVLELFETLGRLSEKVVVDFETFGLPAPEMVEAFARHLHPSSHLIISPESSDEGLRDRHRAFPFSNADLEDRLGQMERLGVQSELYFIIGLPGETRATIEATASWQRDLKRRFPGIKSTFTCPLEMEPNSPWHLHPERFGLTLRHKTFADFHRAHGRDEFSLGYDLETLTEAEILGLHEQHFLPWPPPTVSRLRDFYRTHPRDHGEVRAHA
jgi:radical SAM superfamily enzyme YgiQ (UPF0313 family)